MEPKPMTDEEWERRRAMWLEAVRGSSSDSYVWANKFDDDTVILICELAGHRQRHIPTPNGSRTEPWLNAETVPDNTSIELARWAADQLRYIRHQHELSEKAKVEGMKLGLEGVLQLGNSYTWTQLLDVIRAMLWQRR